MKKRDLNYIKLQTNIFKDKITDSLFSLGVNGPIYILIYYSLLGIEVDQHGLPTKNQTLDCRDVANIFNNKFTIQQIKQTWIELKKLQVVYFSENVHIKISENVEKTNSINVYMKKYRKFYKIRKNMNLNASPEQIKLYCEILKTKWTNGEHFK